MKQVLFVVVLLSSLTAVAGSTYAIDIKSLFGGHDDSHSRIIPHFCSGGSF